VGRLSQRAGKNRLAVSAGLAAAFAIAWLLFVPHGVEQTGEQRVNATVVEIVVGPDGRAAEPAGVAIVVVELPDGGRARVFAPGAQAVLGTGLAVTVKQFSDGTREVTAAGGAVP
tara:strand:- start:2748 stop:3092 length:345 start_codon:yes stop_codon:yes gene_type:complete